MRAVRIEGPRSATIVEVPTPRPTGKDVLVRVAHVGICATDRRISLRGAEPPRIPGHEISGRLEDGTPVGVHPDIGCGRCVRCRAGFENRCAARTSIGIDRDGGLGEWVTAPREHIVPLEGIEPADAALLEPLACCVHALRMLALRPGVDVLVVGAGPMGILAMWALQASGHRVVVSQRSESRRALATELGADAVVAADEDPAPALGGPPDGAVVTASGGAALTAALERVAVGGRVHAFAGSSEPTTIDANLVHYRHLHLVGSTGSALDDYREAARLVREGRVPLGRLPRRVVDLEEAAASLRRPEASPDRKIVIDLGRSSP